MFQKLLYKSYLATYRAFAAFMLYSFLVLVAGMGAYWGFYAVNSGWVVPLSISPSNDHILSLTSQLVASDSAKNTLVVANTNLMKTREELLKHRAALVSLSGQLDSALSKTREANSNTGNELSGLAVQKRTDITQQAKVLNDAQIIRAGIEKDLKLGLITKAEAIQQETTLAQFQGLYTDSRVNEVTLRDNIHQKLANDDLAAVDTLSKQVDLRTQIAQIDLQIATGQDTFNNNLVQIETLKKAMTTTKESPYFLVSQTTDVLHFAFVPYDNQRHVTAGTPIYDCYLSMVVCREVGTIAKVFRDEEHTVNPVYKNDMRGFLIQLTLKNEESAKSRTMFVGGKPLLF